jgi:hypothetical protein
MDLYTHSTTLISHSLSFVATQPPPPPRPRPRPRPLPFPAKRGAALPSLLAPFFESLPLQTHKQQEEFSSVALFLFALHCRSRPGQPADSPPPSQISVVFIFALL